MEETNQNGDNGKSDYAKYLDSDFPLLKEFRDKCPGTFKHSQEVASMAEGVIMKLGYDPTKIKVAATYHDVGKMFHPDYFTENQLDEDNPHDKLDPYVSYMLISRHVSDTALILQQWEFPSEIIRLACQHHGTSVVRYFFDKSEKSDLEDKFRYKGEKPQSVESMVLMLCDCISARSRSVIQAAGREDFDPAKLIQDTYNELEQDRQISEVVMKLGDVATLKEALAKELEGSFQKRVDYNKAKEEKKKEKEKQKEEE